MKFLITTWMWLFSVAYSQLCVALCYSILPPFYPVKAQEKGLQQWQFSLVFSINKVAFLIGSCASERIMNWCSPHRTLLFTVLGSAVCEALIGTLHWSIEGDFFWGASIVLFFVQGMLLIVFTCAAYTVVTFRFKEKCVIMTAVMEGLWGAGSMAGSVIGGALIDLWDFPFPFYIYSAMLGLGALLIYCFPSIQEADTNDDDSQGKQSVLKILKNVDVCIDIITAGLTWVLMGFNEATLRPFLDDKFHLSATVTGSVFTTLNSMYVVGALGWGIACYIFNSEEICLVLGLLLGALGYFFLGPSPVLPYDVPPIWLLFVTQVLIGACLGCMFLCSYSNIIKNLSKRGFAKNLWLYCMVASVIFTAMFIAAILSPILGGLLMEKYGYRIASSGLVLFLMIWTVVLFLRWTGCLGRVMKMRHGGELKISE